jgi:ATP-dependent helicase HepA
MPGMWEVGDRLVHRHNPELGPGMVVSVEGRSVVVEFSRGVTLRLAGDGAALDRLAEGDRGPTDARADLVDRLASGDVDPVEDLALRLDSLHLAGLREADGLGSFLGGRIRLFPHQLHAAERAAAADPVRWLLADEVGLGKTIEACLVLSHLLRTGRADRCLVVAPETLTVQWLGELWRKYHQVFVLLDEERLADVARDHGQGFNPFDAHRRAVVALETLVARPELTALAAEAEIDLLVVDEAHRLRRSPGHPGNPSWRAIAPIAAVGRHLLLLTAIPLDDDVHGFFRLLQLLRPDDFPEDETFEARLARPEPLPPCTSATRRADIGGLPPRVGLEVTIDAEDPGWADRLAVLEAVRETPVPHAVGRRKKGDRVRRALASGAALRAILEKNEEELTRLARRADATDPRLAWLAGRVRDWRDAGEKTLVFVAHRETLDWLREELSRRAQVASGVFHEDLSSARRDIEVARFRLPDGPSLLVSTECGGEGRNFEFCTRLVLFDLPWNPLVVEQRIGRLDRIGRRLPVEVAYFAAPGGIERDVALLYRELGLFREPLAGLEPELARVEAALEVAALSASGRLSRRRFDTIVAGARAAQTRVREAAWREMHRDPYRRDMAGTILGRVPPDLETLTEDVVVAACERLFLRVEPHEGHSFSIELGNQALVDSLPGVPGGTGFLGTFSREEALDDDKADFFAAGHPLVEGVVAHLEESPRGRVGVLRVAIGSEKGLGLLAFYKDGPSFEAVALDSEGRERPDWAGVLTRRPLRTRRVPAGLLGDPGWEPTIRRLAAALDPDRRPVALAAVVVGP